eukprot:Transcript_13807.p1 GENE.Transcript_13807~~Transcript_13807.p1  ORF type:complete len:348 (+),score=12.97 Transcript_13807:55-1098(+)
MSGILTLAALAFAPPGLSPTRVRVATCRSVVPVCVDADAVAVAVDAAATSSKLIAGLPAEQVLGGVAAIALLGGGAAMNSNKNASPPAAPVVAPPPPPPAPPPPPPSPTDWYTGKRTAGYHRSAGRWPGDPKREMWVPPAGWKPPTKPVQSWYDKGLRLEPPPAPPAAPEKAKPSSTAFMDQVKAWFDSLQPEPTAPTPTDWYKGDAAECTRGRGGQPPALRRVVLEARDGGPELRSPARLPPVLAPPAVAAVPTPLRGCTQASAPPATIALLAGGRATRSARCGCLPRAGRRRPSQSSPPSSRGTMRACGCRRRSRRGPFAAGRGRHDRCARNPPPALPINVARRR